MPFDLQSILAAMGMGGGAAGGGSQLPLGAMQGLGGFMTGAGPSGATPASAMGINTGPSQVPTPSPAQGGGGLAGILGLAPNALGGFASPGGVGGSGLGGPMSLLSAGANMLNSSGPGNAGLGSILGSGIGGFVAGGQADQKNALQQQQQIAMQKIAEQLMKQPSGAQPSASSTTPSGVQPAQAVTPPVPMMNAPRPAPQVPGAPTTPGPQGGGGMPLGGMQTNPFLQMMLEKRYGRMI